MAPTTSLLRDNHLLKIVLAFAAIYTIWGTTYLAIRIAVETIPPFFMAGVRFMIAGLALYLFLRLRGVPTPRRLHWRSAFIIGGFMVLGGNGFVTWSEQQVPSGVAALVVATVPLWMTVFDWLIFKGARPVGRVALGVVLGLFGIALLIGPRLFDEAAGVSAISWLILLMAPVLWSLGSLNSRTANLPDNVFMSTSMEMAAGGLLLLLAGGLTGEAAQLDFGHMSSRSLLAMLYLTIFGSIIAFTAYIWLLKNVQATRAATYTYVNPVIAVFLGWLILGEPLTALMLVAAAVIIVAVILIIARREEKIPAQASTGSVAAQPVGARDRSALPAQAAAISPDTE